MELTEPQRVTETLACVISDMTALVNENARLVLLVAELTNAEPDLTGEQAELVELCRERVQAEHERRAAAIR